MIGGYYEVVYGLGPTSYPCPPSLFRVPYPMDDQDEHYRNALLHPISPLIPRVLSSPGLLDLLGTLNGLAWLESPAPCCGHVRTYEGMIRIRCITPPLIPRCRIYLNISKWTYRMVTDVPFYPRMWNNNQILIKNNANVNPHGTSVSGSTSRQERR